jgi:hypothetical protein
MLSVVAAVLSSDPENNVEILKVLPINPKIQKVRNRSYLTLDQLSGCAPQEWHYFVRRTSEYCRRNKLFSP